MSIAFGGMGLYWIVLGALAAWGHRAVRLIWFPFAEGFRPRHGWWLSAVGAGLAAAAAATLAYVR